MPGRKRFAVVAAAIFCCYSLSGPFSSLVPSFLAGLLHERNLAVAGGPSRVITLADEHAADLGVMLSAPTPDRAPDALDQTMALLASGVVRLRAQRQIPIERAPEAHALLDNGAAREKLILTVA